MTGVAEHKTISRFWNKISLVAGISRILREKRATKETLLEVLDGIAEVVPFDKASLYLYKKKRNSLDEVVSRNGQVNLLNIFHFGKGVGMAGWAAEQKRPILIPGRTPEREGVQDFHDSTLILPLLVAGELVGVLCFSHRDPGAFTEERQKLLEIFGDQLAISIERIIYQRELEAANKSLHKAQQELKETQEALINQEKMKVVSELAASVNHEINNPLSAIMGNAQMIEMETRSLPVELSGRVNAIVDGVKRISLITHKLLKINKLVSESYLGEMDKKMINLEQSAGG